VTKIRWSQLLLDSNITSVEFPKGRAPLETNGFTLLGDCLSMKIVEATLRLAREIVVHHEDNQASLVCKLEEKGYLPYGLGEGNSLALLMDVNGNFPDLPSRVRLRLWVDPVSLWATKYQLPKGYESSGQIAAAS
jgi:hypothetical protein